MKNRKWSSQEKLRITLEGLSGQTEISKLCVKYNIAQTQYYKWRDQLLKFGHHAFESKDISKKESHLEEKIQGLTKIIGELTVELKKNEYDL